MTLRLRVPLSSGGTFEIEEQGPRELLTTYEQVNGDGTWLADHLKASVAALERGEVILNPPAETEELVDDPAAETSAPAEDESADPWGAKPSKPASTTTPAREMPYEQVTDRFGREWTMGLPDAPSCYHGAPAARVKAKSQKGNWYTVWLCAKGASTTDFREKCEFKKYPD